MNEHRDRTAGRRRAISAALASITDLIYVFDEECRYVYANRATLDLLHVEFEDLVGQTVRETLGDGTLTDALEGHIREVIETGETIRATARYTNPLGIAGTYEYIFQPHRHDSGTWVIGSSRDVSDLAELAGRLALANEQLVSILESTTDAFYSLDSEWRFTYVNHQAAKLLQRDVDALIGKVIWDEFPQMLETVLSTELHSARSNELAVSFEFFYEPLQTWFEVHAYPSGEFFSVFFRDINEKVRIQRDLETSERRYRNLTNAMPQMVWLTDPNGSHLYFNDRWYEFTGLAEDESLGFGFTKALHPHDVEPTLRKWEEAWRNGASYEVECRFYSSPLDEYRWFLGRAYPLRDQHGVVTEWVGTCTDIEPLKRAEARLLESERRLAEAQRIARIGNWEFDVRTGELSGSEEYGRIFGLAPGDRSSDVSQYAAMVHPEDRDQVYEQRDRILEQGFGSYDIEYRITRTDGQERILHTLAELVTDENGVPAKIVGTIHDITERKEIERALEEYARQQSVLSRELQRLNCTLEQQVEDRTAELRRLSENLERLVCERTAELEESRARLAHQAQHDPLTELPNRSLFEERLEEAIARADRTNRLVAVMFIDLDGFKLVNDSLGHAAGDQALKAISDRLASRLRRSDTLARHGGDEFVSIVEGLRSSDDALAVANDFLAAINNPITLAGHSIRLSGSIGVSMYPQDAQSVAGLQRQADVAMYRAKLSGKNGVRFFSPSMNAAARERTEIASHLLTAVERSELEVYFQPQWRSRTERIESFEALLRWNNPSLGSVSPTRLIPIAEEVGLMTSIGNWVLDTSCAEAARWTRQTGERVSVAVNVSVSQFERRDFVEFVQQVLEERGLAPWQLELEITESSAMSDPQRSIERMTELRELGVRLAIDDFGLGSSSLSNLVRLPLDTVKIDRGFVRDLPENNVADRVIQAIVALTSGIGLDVVAEGVETEAQRLRVLEVGCGRLQGFQVGPPVNRDTALELLCRQVPSSR